jgi:hypothetical protein
MKSIIVKENTYKLLMKLKKQLSTNDGMVQELFYNYVMYERVAKAEMEITILTKQLAELTTQEAVDKFIKEHTLEVKS